MFYTTTNSSDALIKIGASAQSAITMNDFSEDKNTKQALNDRRVKERGSCLIAPMALSRGFVEVYRATKENLS